MHARFARTMASMSLSTRTSAATGCCFPGKQIARPNSPSRAGVNRLNVIPTRKDRKASRHGVAGRRCWSNLCHLPVFSSTKGTANESTENRVFPEIECIMFVMRAKSSRSANMASRSKETKGGSHRLRKELRTQNRLSLRWREGPRWTLVGLGSAHREQPLSPEAETPRTPEHNSHHQRAKHDPHRLTTPAHIASHSKPSCRR